MPLIHAKFSFGVCLGSTLLGNWLQNNLMILINILHLLCCGKCGLFVSERFCPGLGSENTFSFVRRFPIHKYSAYYFLDHVYTACIIYFLLL